MLWPRIPKCDSQFANDSLVQAAEGGTSLCPLGSLFSVHRSIFFSVISLLQSVCVCMHTHAHMHSCVSTFVHALCIVHMYVHVCIYMFVYTMCMHRSVYCVCTHICVCACVYTCVHGFCMFTPICEHLSTVLCSTAGSWLLQIMARPLIPTLLPPELYPERICLRLLAVGYISLLSSRREKLFMFLKKFYGVGGKIWLPAEH